MWFLMVRREPVGPLTEEEVLERIRRGEVTARTYAWKEGFDDWERLGYLPPFMELTGDPGAETPRAGKRRGTLPLPELGQAAQGASGSQPAAGTGPRAGEPPAGLAGEEDVDPAAVTSRWEPAQVADAIVRSGRRPAEVVEQHLRETSRPAVVVQEPPSGPAPPSKHLDEDLAELFGSKPRIDRAASAGTPRAAPPEPASSQPEVVVEELQPPRPKPALVVEEPQPEPAVDPGADTLHDPGSAPDVEAEARATRIGHRSSEPGQQAPVSGELDHCGGPGQQADRLPPMDDPEASVESEIEPEPAPPPAEQPQGMDSLGEMADQAVSPAEPEPLLDAEDYDRVLHNKLVGERAEDSVLFSRSQLSRLVRSIDSGEYSAVGDSLIDIKPLAPSEGESLPGFAPLPGAAAMPIMMPAADSDAKRGLGVVLLVSFFGILLALGALGGVLYLVKPRLVRTLLGSEDEPPPVAQRSQDPPAPAAAAAEPKQPPAAEPGAVASTAPPAGDTAAAGTAAETAAKATPRPRRKAKVRRASPAPARPSPPPSPVAATPRPPPARPRPAPAPAKKSSSGDELDRLIDQATGGGSRPRPAPAPARPVTAPPPEISNLPDSLTRQQVVAGMKRATIGVQDCRAKMDRGDAVTVQVTIDGRTGRITRGKAVGKYAGTPAGECVAISAQFAARFPKFSGPPITLKYPFIIK
jgi:hypothetical protein